ncbi:MAG: hypothetical protein SOI38_04985 [Eggerthellaceae bacterium]|jgi:hypothetical protein
MEKRTSKRTAAQACAVAVALSATLALSACESGQTTASSSASENETANQSSSQSAQTASSAPQASDIITDTTYESTVDGEHAITADGETASYQNACVVKTGDSTSESADFYGDNAAIFATNGATLGLSDLIVDTSGSHANAVFSYGSGTTVNVSDSVITTNGNNSGGLMTTGGGTTNATNLSISTSGNSSAAIRSDRGGGTVNVVGGDYATSGTGSPVIYSTADITATSAVLDSTASQGVVVEGKNSVTLNDCVLTASNVTKNSDKSDYYQAVMIYQSASGDAANGTSAFTMNGGSLINQNGDVFFVNNTTTTIDLAGAHIQNNGDGVFLRAAAAGWGTSGSNGGQVTLNASGQVIDGDMVVDDVSSLNLYLTDGSTFTGTVNADGQAGDVYVELAGGSTWTLTDDAYISGLTCDAGSINLNGHTLYVDGTPYTADSASVGSPIDQTVQTSSGGAPDGTAFGGDSGDMPNGSGFGGDMPGGGAPSGR